MARRKKTFTKKDARVVAGCLTLVFAIVYYPCIWLWKGIVWLWDKMKPWALKLKDLIFSDYSTNNEQNDDAI